jgi:hypothetical protein
MHMRRNPDPRSAEMRGIERRRFFRRLAIGRPRTRGQRGPFECEAIAEIDRQIALEFRPKLREEVTFDGATVRRASIEIALTGFEGRVLVRCDGQATLHEAAVIAKDPAEGWSDDEAIDAAIALMAGLGRLDLLETGVQWP